jgi:chromosome segregation ATPase
MSDEDSKKRKRERNNESVRKCRQNEKKKINTASQELDKYKQEYRELEDKYMTLQKELQTLKSLFQAPLQATNLSSAVVATLTQQQSTSVVSSFQTTSNVKNQPATCENPNQSSQYPVAAQSTDHLIDMSNTQTFF